MIAPPMLDGEAQDALALWREIRGNLHRPVCEHFHPDEYSAGCELARIANTDCILCSAYVGGAELGDARR